MAAMDVDASGQQGSGRQWSVSEQKTSNAVACAKCHNIFHKGELRLRPAGTVRTRLIHPSCSHGLVDGIGSIVNFGELCDTHKASLQQALAHAVPGGPGDDPAPAVDARALATEHRECSTDIRLSRYDEN